MTALFIILSLLTTYSQSTFHTSVSATSYKSEWTTATDGVGACSATVDSVLYYLQQDPQKLSVWAFAGMGKQKDTKKDAVYLHWKDGSYDPENHRSKLLMDVLVNGVVMFRNISVESTVKDSVYKEGRDIRVDIYYSGTLLKSAYGNFHILPQQDGSIAVKMDTHIRFGWFFNIFITKKVFADTIDWRLERFVKNICLKARGITPTDEYWAQQDKQKQ